MHRLYCWSNRPILCGNLIEFDGKKCLYSRFFRFYKHFDTNEKTWDALHTKKERKKKKIATIPLLANADKIHMYKIE